MMRNGFRYHMPKISAVLLFVLLALLLVRPIRVEAANPPEDFDYDEASTYIYIKGYIGDPTATSIVVPDTINGKPVNFIEAIARHNTYITSLSLPDTLTVVSQEMCSGCTSLTNVKLPASAEINSYVFYGCTSLENVTIPANTQKIGECIFNNCTNLKSVTINTTTANVSSSAFVNTSGSPINDHLTIYLYRGSGADTAAQGKGYNIVYIGESGGGSIPDTDASDFRYPAIALFMTAIAGCLAIGLIKRNMAK